MKNVTLDGTTVLQLDADCTDSALDATADCNALRNDVALDLCAPPLEIMPQKKKLHSTAGLGLKGIQTHGTKLQTYLCQLNAAFL